MRFDRVTIAPGVMAGMPCIRGLPFPVAAVVAMVADGMTVEEILAVHPDLEAGDVRQALSYSSGGRPGARATTQNCVRFLLTTQATAAV